MTTIDLSGFEQEIEKAVDKLLKTDPLGEITMTGSVQSWWNHRMTAAITAFLTAAIESGKAREAFCTVVLEERWYAHEYSVPGSNFPAIILKLEPKP